MIWEDPEPRDWRLQPPHIDWLRAAAWTSVLLLSLAFWVGVVWAALRVFA